MGGFAPHAEPMKHESLSFPRMRKSAPTPKSTRWIPAFAGMTIGPQNKKYFYAIGSLSAGSQTSSSPSAVMALVSGSIVIFGLAPLWMRLFLHRPLRVFHRYQGLLHFELAGETALDRRVGDKGQRRFRPRAPERAEHRAIVDALRGRDRGVGVAHLRRGDRAALDHQIGRHAKERWGPEHEVGDPPGAPAFTGSAPAAAQARGQARPHPAKPSQTKLKRPPVEMWESGRAKPEALECGPLDLFPLLRHAPNCKRAGDGATLGRVKGVNNDAGRPVRFINAMTIMVCADCPKETVRCHFMCATPRR